MPMSRRTLDGAELKLLVLHPHPECAESIAAPLRQAAFRVIALSRLEAAVPLYEAFAPAVALIHASPGDVGAAFEAARRLRTASAGILPVLYLCEGSASLRKLCLEEGDGLDAIAFPEDKELLALRARAAARYGQALQRSVRAQLSSHRDPSLRDPTTDAAKPALFVELAAQALKRGERSGESFSVMAIKLLRFPRFVKEHGAALAERLVNWASITLRQTFRESDSMARVGESELALLLAGADADHSHALVARITDRIARSRFEVEGRVIRPEVSVGVASFPELLTGPEDYLRAAREDAHTRRPDLQTGATQLQDLAKMG